GVVEGQLLDVGAADAIRTAIADVANPGALGPEDECRGRGAEALELRVVLTNGVDRLVRLAKSTAKGRTDSLLGDVLEEGQGDVANGLGAGLLADGVPAHAIGHDE